MSVRTSRVSGMLSWLAQLADVLRGLAWTPIRLEPAPARCVVRPVTRPAKLPGASCP